MIARAGVLALACLGPWLAPLTASAQQPPAAVAAEWGLLGRWAPTCARPPGPGNTHTTYAALPNGRVSVTDDDGSGKSTKKPELFDTTKSEIFTASIRADGVLMISESFATIRMSRDIWFMKGRDGRRRVLLSRTNGRHWAAEGKVIDTGRETLWESRCP